MARSVAARLLGNPAIWVAFLFMEWVAGAWLVSRLLPGDPADYPTWVAVSLLFLWTVLLTTCNDLLRRRVIDVGDSSPGSVHP